MTLVVVLCGLLAAAARLGAAQQQQAGTVWSARTGQDVANAAYAFGLSGLDTTVQLPPGARVDLRDALFRCVRWLVHAHKAHEQSSGLGSRRRPQPPAMTPRTIVARDSGRIRARRLANDSEAVNGRAYSSGTFTIQGAVNPTSVNGTGVSVLDTGMRARLTASLRGTATAHLSNVVVTNVCYHVVRVLGYWVFSSLTLQVRRPHLSWRLGFASTSPPLARILPADGAHRSCTTRRASTRAWNTSTPRCTCARSRCGPSCT